MTTDNTLSFELNGVSITLCVYGHAAVLTTDTGFRAVVPVPGKKPFVAPKTMRRGMSDDLKLIQGIGVLIEKKLLGVGISHFDQLAALDQDGIDYLSLVFDFKGRIERENWVGQAAILASGGSTEFSRRVTGYDASTKVSEPYHVAGHRIPG